MDHLGKLRQQLWLYFCIVTVLANSVAIGVYWLIGKYSGVNSAVAFGASLVIGVLLAVTAAWLCAKYAIRPLQALWQAIVHLNPSEQGVAAPDLNTLRVGRELITNLSAQVYQLANLANTAADESRRQLSDLHHNFIAQNLPLPLLILDAAETIQFANEAAARYIGIASADMIGKNVYMVLDMFFTTENTFDSWLKSVKTKNATAYADWERVRLNVHDDHPPRLFDLAAYYNRDNADHNETMLVLFDHTNQYSQDEQAVSFIALSVHELRTPLTLLRGYIEVFEEELGPGVSPELHDFMLKMHSQAEQLTAYVNNILNVARVDDDQLELKLQSEDWSAVLKNSIEMISLRAKVRGITLKCRIARDLPPVGVDRLSISEVISNLVDNAIKYSGPSKEIRVNTYLNQAGLIETVVQDFGVGISTSILPNLFTKFYRDHRNRAQIGGTGLGLYLSKAIVDAHGGSIWIRSKEGEGSSFGFTLLPYAKLAEGAKLAGDQEITRGAHSWIKNHSLYRR